jgi:SAM-dependent methyltransferase
MTDLPLPGHDEVARAAWETAFLRFESSEEEVSKFRRRLVRLGAKQWPTDSAIVELFCGRGNGLRALVELGFKHVEGVDDSPRLLALCPAAQRRVLADCRALPFESESRDIVVAHGGLHHLERLPQDVDLTLAEAARVLRPGGRFVAVEPWHTPFLSLAHAACRSRLLRRLWPKLDALAEVTELERVTYEQWLAAPEVALRCLEKHFRCERRTIAWGKLMWMGVKPRHGWTRLISS